LRRTFDWPTSFAVPVQPAARELLRALAPVLARWGRWYLFGAQADEFLTRAVTVDLGGTPVPVIHVEDLMIGKILAGRPKDLEDVKALWQLHGATADAGRIRTVLALLEEALSQSDLVPAFDSISIRAKRTDM